jgi:hypothetical protein
VIVRTAALHYLVMIPVQLEYTAPAGCPTQSEFVAFVTNRGGDFAHPGPKTKARTMVVTLRREANEHTGSLELRLDDTASDARQLHAPSCAEVAEALAVVAAIALRGADKASEPVEAPPATSSVPEPVVSPAAKPAPVTTPSATPSAAPTDTRLRSVGLWGNEQLPVTAGPLQVNRSLTATLSGGVVLGTIPGVVLPRYDLTLMRTNFITTPQRSSYIIGNVFGVRWSYLGSATRRSGGFSTELNGFKAGVSSCASLAYDTTGFVALLCSSFTVGLMHLETKDLASDYQQSKDIGLGAASLDLDARYNIGKYLHVGLAAGGEVWISKLSAERADGSELFHSRLFNVNVQLGLGVHF